MKPRYWQILIVALLALVGSKGQATDPAQLNAALLQMQRLELDNQTGRRVANLQLKHTDLTLTLEAGRLVFARPVQLDSLTKFYGAYFSGKASIQFAPPVFMERRQLHRFFESDSLNRQVESAFLLFNDKTYHQLADSTAVEPFAQSKDDLKDFANFHDRLTERENYSYLFAALKNLARPRTQPFLAALVKLKNGDVVMYLFDPYQREEVRLLKHRERFIVSEGLETVCQYSVYLDTTYEQLNGIEKAAINVSQYKLNGTLEDDGDFGGSAMMSITGAMAGAQMIELSLHPRLGVDSIRDGDGREVNFRRWTKDDNRASSFWVILNRPLDLGAATSLSVYYHGKLGSRHLGRLQSFAGADWYPRYERTQKATFDITLTAPGKYLCVVAGQFVDSIRQDKMLTTHWQVTRPTSAVSFDVGDYERFLFTAPDIPPVVVYHLTGLHRDSATRMISRPLTMNPPESEAGVSNAAKMYNPATEAVSVGREARQLTKPMVLDLLTGRREDELRQVEFGDSLRAGGRQMERQVAEDIQASLRLFSASFGQLPCDTIRVVETMNSVADVVPGIIHLGYETFFSTDHYGSERARRGRSAALQWFGGLVNYATYHDQWLSEGLATYCGLWYLQSAGGQDQFQNFMEQARKSIITLNQYALGERQEPGPVALGYRTATSKSQGDMDVIIYLKGAYVLHMLRHMLLDLTNLHEEAYLAMLREYVTLLRDKDATTDLFRQVVEKHAGQDMHWFFNQWVYRSEIPEYALSYTIKQGQGTSWTASGEITRSGVPGDFKMYVPIEVAFEGDGRWYTRVLVDKPSVNFDLPPFSTQPKRILLNPFGSVLGEAETK